MNTNPAFLELVQLHERTWGTETYPGRPSLADLMSASIVVMWVTATPLPSPASVKQLRQTQPANFMLECYEDSDALNTSLLNLLMAGRPTTHTGHRISKVYVNGEELEITGLKLLGQKKVGQ